MKAREYYYGLGDLNDGELRNLINIIRMELNKRKGIRSRDTTATTVPDNNSFASSDNLIMQVRRTQNKKQ